MRCSAARQTIRVSWRCLSINLSAVLLLVGVVSLVDAHPIHYVTVAGAGLGNGSSWDNAHTGLQAALEAAVQGDEIWVAQGTYKPSVPAGRDATFQLINGVAVYGGFAGDETLRSQRNWEDRETILSGDLLGQDPPQDNSYHVVTGSGTDTSAVLDGFAVMYGLGDSSERGGGMYNVAGSPTVRNCTFSYNYASRGGGMYNGAASSPTVTHCVFRNNEAGDGGGMYNCDHSSPTVTDCTFSFNEASRGGGMYNQGSSPTVTDCSFIGNEAAYSGGGMYNRDSSPAVTECDFFGNFIGSYGNGGGMYSCSESDPAVSGCTFSGNEADFGGGMHSFDSSPNVTDCTFTNNRAHAGGGMYSSSGSPMVIRCTFSGNEAAAGGGMQNGGSLPMTVTDCTFSDNVASYYGGAMSNAGARTMTVIDCTFSGNSAELGGGMYNYNHCNPTVVSCTFFDNSARVGGGIYDSFTTSAIGNTILARNTPNDCAPPVTSLGYNLEGGTSCGCTQPTDQQNTDPLLDPDLQDNGGPTLTHVLLPGSPALDAIPPPYNGAPTTDQRGLPRPYPANGLADIGAVEMQLAYSRGDVNGDGAIDLLDVVLCAQIAGGCTSARNSASPRTWIATGTSTPAT